MGESSSACLVRSFSQPSQDRSEGDPLRALTTSISFGRFMSESLDWEKWSSFTHNRYQEEVEKYSRPGSVAEKKAYFEAHYKNLAAKKKAAALLEQQNAAVNVSSDMNATNENTNHSTMDSELTESNSNVNVEETRGEETSSNVNVEETQREEGDLTVVNQTIDYSQTNSELTEGGKHGSIEEQLGEGGDRSTRGFECIEEVLEEELNNAKLSISTCGSNSTHEETNLETIDKEKPTEQSSPMENDAESLNKSENVVQVHENIPQLEEKTHPKNAATPGDSVLSTKKKPSTLTSRLKNNIGLSNLRSHVKSTTPLQPKETDHCTPTTRKNGKEVIDKKRSTPRSLHMSINFSSSTGEMSKALSPVLEKIANSRLVRSITKTSKDNKVQQIPTMASVSGISKRPSETHQLENRRTRTQSELSFSRSRKEEGDLLSNSRKSTSTPGSKARSSIVSSSFSLRSEERAAKRREFYQKLEEKQKAKEAEKEQLQAKQKGRATNCSRVKGDVLTSRAKPQASSIHHEKESSGELVKKIPIRPCSPEISRKLVSKVQDNKSRPPWRLSGKPNGSNDENNLPRSHTPKLFLRESMQENASPNIQF